jgi:hypothetical protein
VCFCAYSRHANLLKPLDDVATQEILKRIDNEIHMRLLACALPSMTMLRVDSGRLFIRADKLYTTVLTITDDSARPWRVLDVRLHVGSNDRSDDDDDAFASNNNNNDDSDADDGATASRAPVIAIEHLQRVHAILQQSIDGSLAENVLQIVHDTLMPLCLELSLDSLASQVCMIGCFVLM